MTLQQFLLILWAWRKLILIIFGLTLASVLTVSLLLPPKYKAETTVVLDVKSPDPIVGAVLPGMMNASYMATQMEIINSPRVAQQVVKMLNMANSPEAQELWREDTNGRGDIVVWLAEMLRKNLDVLPSRDGNVITIQFTNISPNFAAVVANAFAGAYIESNVELRVDPARQYASWFDTQIRRQREDLEKAQKALSDYQQETGIVSVDERLDSELQRLNALTAQLGITQAEKAEITGRLRMVSDNTLPEVIQNPLLNQLKGDLARQEAKLQEMAGNLGENHPRYRQALAEVQDLRARLITETNRINASVLTQDKVITEKTLEIEQAISEQKKRILDLRMQRDQLNVLQRDVMTAQQTYDTLSQRLTQSTLEAQSVQTNISVLTPATPPLEPSSPKTLLNMLIATVLGIMLSLGTALALELSKRRVRVSQDLLDALDLPLLAQLDSHRAMRPRLYSRVRLWRNVKLQALPAKR